MPDIKARIFGPNLPNTGVDGLLSLGLDALEVKLDSQRQSVAFTNLKIREVGFERPGVEFAWQSLGENWAAHVLDSNTARELLSTPALAALSEAVRLKRVKVKNKVGRTIGVAALGAIVFLPLLLLLALVLSASRISGWLAEQVSVETEVKWGQQAFAGMRGKLTLLDDGPAVDAVQALGGRLAAGSRYRYEFYVADDPSLNAFALPGGVIVVNTGLINATTRAEQLAGVLAHEVQHVEQRHSIRGMIKAIGLRGLWAVVTGDLGGTLAGEAALQLTSLKFSRDDEADADHLGLEAMVKAGIDPMAMPEFFKIMNAQAPDAPVGFISTHPLSAERARDLSERIKKLPPREYKALVTTQWPPR